MMKKFVCIAMLTLIIVLLLLLEDPAHAAAPTTSSSRNQWRKENENAGNDDGIGGREGNVTASSRLQGRIIGGKPVQPKFKDDFVGHFCGGSLIAEDTVLTAAHCVFGRGIAGFNVHTSRYNIDDELSELIPLETSETGFQNVRSVQHVAIANGFDPWSLENDIAVVSLVPRATNETGIIDIDPTFADRWTRYGGAYRPSGNSSEVSLYGGFPSMPSATAIGWGRVEEYGAPSPVLLAVDLPLVTDAECTAAYGSDVNTDVMFCAGYKSGGDDSCAGDSGGPFFMQTGDDQFAQVGIVSWGRGCGRRRQYGVYTRLSSFMDFLNETVPHIQFTPPPAPPPPAPPPPAAPIFHPFHPLPPPQP